MPNGLTDMGDVKAPNQIHRFTATEIRRWELKGFTSDNLIDLMAIQNLFIQKGTSQSMKCLKVVLNDPFRFFVALSDNRPDL